MIFKSDFMDSGKSWKSLSLAKGRITIFTPPLLAAISFSLIPPTGNTFPKRSKISVPITNYSCTNGQIEVNSYLTVV